MSTAYGANYNIWTCFCNITGNAAVTYVSSQSRSIIASYSNLATTACSIDSSGNWVAVAAGVANMYAFVGTWNGSTSATVASTIIDNYASVNFAAGYMTLAYNTVKNKYLFTTFGDDSKWWTGLLTVNPGTSVTLNQWAINSPLTTAVAPVDSTTCAELVYYPLLSTVYAVVGTGSTLFQPITISGTSFTAETVTTPSGSPANSYAYPFYNSALGYLQTCTYGSIGFSYNAVSTNLTTNNFLGFSSASYTNGQTATINVISGTDNNQTSLTAGSKYYVNSDGTLTTTSGNSYAGLALSSTKILIKG